jgi:membrane protein
MIVLLGAVVAACVPGVMSGAQRRKAVHGLEAALSLQLLARLDAARQEGQGGVTLSQVARELRTDAAQLTPVLTALGALGWVGRLDEAGEARLVLLADPASLPLAAWFDRLVIGAADGTTALRAALGVTRLHLSDVLPARPPASGQASD